MGQTLEKAPTKPQKLLYTDWSNSNVPLRIGVEVGDKQKYSKRSIAAQWGVQKPHLKYIRGLWECRCTYSSTDVCGVQENVAIENDAVGF
jgi:hypothetical protein